MKNEYYYLVASLPYLRFREAPPMTGEMFLAESGKWLPERDMDFLLDAAAGPDPERVYCSFLMKWFDFDAGLFQEIADYRKSRKKGEDTKPAGLAGRVLEQPDPLQREIFLEKNRWDFLEDLAGGHFYDVEKLTVYYLQLLILERLNKFDKDKGESRFYEMCEVKYDEETGQDTFS